MNKLLLIDGPHNFSHTLVLAHGAGAPMDSPFMAAFATGIANEGLRVVRFEFPYMVERRCSGRKRPPDREPILRQAWQAVIEQLASTQPASSRLVIGGKSLGGRIASLIADETNVAGLVCLGYPFHPAGQPDRLRTEHLENIQTPTLILQGTRDPFGAQDEVLQFSLSPAIQLHWLADGDHSFKPRKASGRTEEINWHEAIEATAAFVKNLP